jgi:hypothetical protein
VTKLKLTYPHMQMQDSLANASHGCIRGNTRFECMPRVAQACFDAPSYLPGPNVASAQTSDQPIFFSSHPV